MSSFHGKTRPDAPRIPQDLATKGYVDDATTHDHLSIIGAAITDIVAFGDTEFICVFPRAGYNSSEVIRAFGMPFACTLSDFLVVIDSNTLDDVKIVTMRVNLADGNETVTVPAATSGDFSDLVNTDVFVRTDEQGYEDDNSASTAGGGRVVSISNLCLVTP